MLAENIKKLAKIWHDSPQVELLSGAGMSTASGLPDFRSRTGLWRQKPESLATLAALDKTPDEFYFFYQWRIAKLWQIQPNSGHIMLADMEKRGKIQLIVTQNVDSLHQRAGAANVTELHGSLRTVSCLNCGTVYDSKVIIPSDWTDEENSDGYKHGKECCCVNCGGRLRPDVVLFGEQLPLQNWRRAVTAAQQADLIIVLGSSLLVGPANQLPDYTLERGGKLAIINNDHTRFDHLAAVVIHDDIPSVLQKVQQEFYQLQ